MLVILDRVVDELISPHLWSWWNVCWGIFLVTWYVVFVLTVVDLVLVSINISTSWVDWRSFVASLSICWWLSWLVFVFLDKPWWVLRFMSLCLALIIMSIVRHLRTSLHRGLDSRNSLALKSWLWCFANRLDTKLIEINSVLLDLILGDSRENVSFLKILYSFWLCLRNHVSIFHIEFLEVWCGLDCHACWSLEWSVLVLSFW